MSISSTRIANFALSKIGERSSIESLDEDSSEAQTCDLWFSFAREQALSSFNWSFARKRVILASSSDVPPDEWGYRYLYPSDCLKARYVENPLGTQEDPVPFDVELDSNGNRSILVNIPEAKLVYTANIADPTNFPPYFVDYFATILARYIAFSLTGKAGIVDKLDNEARILMTLAAAMDANERQERAPRNPDWIRNR